MGNSLLAGALLSPSSLSAVFQLLHLVQAIFAYPTISMFLRTCYRSDLHAIDAPDLSYAMGDQPLFPVRELSLECQRSVTVLFLVQFLHVLHVLVRSLCPHRILPFHAVTPFSRMISYLSLMYFCHLLAISVPHSEGSTDAFAAAILASALECGVLYNRLRCIHVPVGIRSKARGILTSAKLSNHALCFDNFHPFCTHFRPTSMMSNRL